MDTGTNAGNTSDTKDASGIDSTNNNVDNKNAYVKANFSTHNVAGANASVGAGDANRMDEKVSSNINNIDVSQSGRVGRANKCEMGGADKSGVSGPDKDGAGRANIEVGKKADAGAITNTNNSADDGGKITD